MITESYIKRLIYLAEEVRELQLEAVKKIPKDTPVDLRSLIISSKINHLLGYILALDTFDKS